MPHTQDGKQRQQQVRHQLFAVALNHVKFWLACCVCMRHKSKLFSGINNRDGDAMHDIAWQGEKDMGTEHL